MLDIQCLFPSQSLKVCTSEQMREFDRRAVDEFGVPSIVLMENAGRHVSQALRELYGPIQGKRICIVAGKGNNGGDGFVVARQVRDLGAEVSVFLLGDPSSVKGDAKINLEILSNTGLLVESVNSASDLQMALSHSHVIVDAIFGTGLKGNVTGLAAEVISAINSTPRPVVSVDIPSGLDADTGQVLGICVEADDTVTFALPKLGLLTFPGAAYIGKLIVGEIGIPSQLYDELNIELTLKEWVTPHLPGRPANSYKGTYGHLFVMAGSRGLIGAASMASEAAIRIGVGLCTLGTPGSLQDVLASKVNEVMTIGLPETSVRSLSVDALDPALEFVKKATAVAMGCGMGHHPDTCKFVQQFVRSIDKPVVVDADGLNCLAGSGVLEGAHGEIVITPHPGEMSRLLGKSTGEIESDRLSAVREASARFHCVAVLKGARTLVADPTGRVFMNPTGNPGLATGGTGDVLTGAIGSLLAQGLNPFDAAVCGVYVHGMAGDIAADEIGPAGMIAGDVICALPKALKELSN